MRDARVALAIILAIANWLSLMVFIWLLTLNLITLGWIQVFALTFFLLVAMVATAYDPESSSRPKVK